MAYSLMRISAYINNKKKELDGLQESNKDMTRGEARKKRRSINKYLKNNDLTNIKL